jgi:HPt (histidine-containing phosphotransfer) domain-containing protein
MEQPNMDYIDSLAAGDVAFRQKLVAILQAELPQEVGEYKARLERGDLHNAAESVHKLKHKISLLGMEKSYYIAEQFEVNLKDGTTGLHDHFEDILNTMQQFAAAL